MGFPVWLHPTAAGLSLAALAEYVSDWAADPAQALDEAERWARRAVELDDQEPVSAGAESTSTWSFVPKTCVREQGDEGTADNVQRRPNARA